MCNLRFTLLLLLGFSTAQAAVVPVTPPGSVVQLAADRSAMHVMNADATRAPALEPICGFSTPGVIVRDSNYIYALEAVFSATDVRWANEFTPSSYPATFTTVCVAFVAFGTSTPQSLNFDVIVLADDGVNGPGLPGTLLASKSFTAEVPPAYSPPFPQLQPFDISDLGVNITSGKVYIGVHYNGTGFANQYTYMALDADTGSGDPGFGGSNFLGSFTWYGPQIPNLIRVVQGASGGTSATSVAQAFSPSTIGPGQTATLTITLANSGVDPALLNAMFVDTLPGGLLVAPNPNVSTTCSSPISVTSQLIRLAAADASGVPESIPASSSCSITVDVIATTGGTYANTIGAGALQTTNGNSPSDTIAVLTVTGDTGAQTNGVFRSPLLNRVIAPLPSGEAINWVSGYFNDSYGYLDEDMTLITDPDYGPTFAILTQNYYNGGLAITADKDIAHLQSGDIVGPNSLMLASGSLLAPSNGSVWLAGTDAYIGFSFICDGRLRKPVASGVCFGYAHVVVGSGGLPLTLVDYAYDGDGNPITVGSDAADLIFKDGFDGGSL